MFVVAETGLILGVDDLANVITALGVILIAFAYVYIETGHRDLRVAKRGRPSMVESLVQMRFGKRVPMLDVLKVYSSKIKLAAYAILIIGIVGAVGYLTWSYQALKVKVAEADAALVEMRLEVNKAVEAAEANKAALDRAEASYKRQIDAVVRSYERQQKMIDDIAAADALLDATPDENNGAMAPVLKNWRPSYGQN